MHTLITAAIKRQGLASKSALARSLGCTPSRLFAWAAGSRVMPAPRLAHLAELAGRDPARVLGQYSMERMTKK